MKNAKIATTERNYPVSITTINKLHNRGARRSVSTGFVIVRQIITFFLFLLLRTVLSLLEIPLSYYRLVGHICRYCCKHRPHTHTRTHVHIHTATEQLAISAAVKRNIVIFSDVYPIDGSCRRTEFQRIAPKLVQYPDYDGHFSRERIASNVRKLGKQYRDRSFILCVATVRLL
mgnify:CR=1 FL=1